MTVSDCITYIDSIEPNAYTAEQKTRWLSECEGKVYTELFLVQPYEFSPVVWDADRTLAIPAPYDRLYPRYLQAMIHYANGEYDRYANSMAVFNEVWSLLNRWFGGDYDVTDRRRNRRITAEISPELGDGEVFRVPEGCAVAAGRIVTAQAFTPPEYPTLILKEALPSGTYAFEYGDSWYHVTFQGAAIPAGAKLWIVDNGGTVELHYLPDPDDPMSLELLIEASAGKSGTVLDFGCHLRVWFGEPDNVIAEKADFSSRGALPLPMAEADRGGGEIGITLGPGEFGEGGKLLFTGHLLIPDEEFPFN